METMSMPSAKNEQLGGTLGKNLESLQNITEEQIEKGEPSVVAKLKDKVFTWGNTLLAIAAGGAAYGIPNTDFQNIAANIGKTGGSGEAALIVATLALCAGVTKKLADGYTKERAMKLAK